MLFPTLITLYIAVAMYLESLTSAVLASAMVLIGLIMYLPIRDHTPGIEALTNLEDVESGVKSASSHCFCLSLPRSPRSPRAVSPYSPLPLFESPRRCDA